MRPLAELLTPEELKAADDAWRASFLDTTPITFDEATYRPWVDAFYQGLGRSAPRHIRYFRSLMGCCLALDAEQVALEAETAKRCAAQGIAVLSSPAANAIATAVDKEYRDPLLFLPSDEAIGPAVTEWMQPGFVHPRRANVIAFLHDMVFTNADAAFGVYYDVLEAKGLAAEIPSAAQQMRALAKAVGYLFLFDDLCLIIDRPAFLALDEQDAYHAHDGPAITFRDGYTRAFSHGMEIPREAVTPGVRETWLTAARIRDEENAEQRRVFLELYGTQRFIKDLGIKPIDASDYGTLYKVPFTVGPEDEPLTLLHVINSTEEYEQYEIVDRAHWLDRDGNRHDSLPGWIAPDGLPDGWRYVAQKKRGIGEPHRKEYWLRVPPTMERARQAVAWTFNLEEEQYQPVQES